MILHNCFIKEELILQLLSFFKTENTNLWYKIQIVFLSLHLNGQVLSTITPSTNQRCLYFWAFCRNYNIHDQANTIELKNGVTNIFAQNEAILEAQQEAINQNPNREFYNLNIDAGAMWARRITDKMIAKEQ